MRADKASKNSHINDADIEISLIIAFVRNVSIFIVIFEKNEKKSIFFLAKFLFIIILNTF